jgi:hypothetical protein
MDEAGRILHRDWDRYDTRQAVFRPARMTTAQLEAGYWRAYERFYGWSNIARASLRHGTWSRSAKHFAYSGGWKKLEPIWDAVIRTRHLHGMRPILEAVLATVGRLAHDAPTSEERAAA